MRLTLVRHGETTGQSSIRYYGATDVPLSQLGEEQMRRAGAALAHERFDALLCSRLQRARHGAALVSGERLEAQPLAAFDEVHFGDWEGWTREEIAARDAERYRRWRKQPEDFVYPGGECRRAFQERVVAGLDTILAAPPGSNLLVVVHRGVIAVLLTRLLALSSIARRRLAVDLGSIHVVARRDGAWQPEGLNRIDHLDAAVARERAPG